MLCGYVGLQATADWRLATSEGSWSLQLAACSLHGHNNGGGWPRTTTTTPTKTTSQVGVAECGGDGNWNADDEDDDSGGLLLLLLLL